MEVEVIVDIINELTEHRNNTENFLRSLRHIDNGLLIADFFKLLKESGHNYEIIRGYDYLLDGLASEFKEILFKSNNLDISNIKIPENLELICNSEYFILLLK